MASYIFASSGEVERLQLQSRVWEPSAEAMLEGIGVGAGWRCLDLGCGVMGILGPLSRRVGPGGEVVGVDRDAAHLAAARDFLEGAGLDNVRLWEGDASQTGLPRASFDLVHARFLLPHVVDPAAVLAEMVALARPGGVVVLQEPIHEGWAFYPPSERWSRLRQILEAGIALRGDINIGARSYDLLRGAGLHGVTVRAAVLALPPRHPYMRMPLAPATAMRPRMIEAGITTAEELDELLAELERLASDPDRIQITFTLTQVWGRRP